MPQTVFQKVKTSEMLGITPISRVTDREIWTRLVTPMAKALLGKIESGYSVLKETIEGEFPGDTVTNLNDHRLYGGQPGFVRNPYIESVYKTTNGCFVVKRDGVKIKAFGWYGDYKNGKADMIYKVALRDRRFDGTKRGDDTALVDYTYADPDLNGPLVCSGGQPIDAASVELSVYCFMPGSKISDVDSELKEYEYFVLNPFSFLDRPEKFIEYFRKAWRSKRAPGQASNPIPDVSKIIVPELEKVAKKYGYEIIENCPSHYHVAMWSAANKYRFTEPEQAETMQALAAGIKKIKESGVVLTRPQESWVCVLQSLDISLVPDDLKPLHLGADGPKWPQDNIGPKNLWMNKPLTPRVEKMLPNCRISKSMKADLKSLKAEKPQ